jgi:GYF domain 2
MSNRSWFFASQGKQQGPYPEAQLREFIANGTVTAETLVWSEGMAGWQKAGEIPGMFAGASGSPPVPQWGGLSATGGTAAGQLISVDFSIWALLGRALLFVIGFLLVIPAPWTATSFYRWFIERLRVPQRPDPGFAGKPGDIWYVFVIQGLCSYAGFSDDPYPLLIAIPLQAFLSWMTIRWIVANISSQGRHLPLTFAGSPWAYLGWYLLLYVSVITIIGWAWVTTAWIRWICRNITGTRRTILFNASGWQILWRTLVFALAAAFIIPIPWAMGWYARWYVSQFVLVERTAYATA